MEQTISKAIYIYTLDFSTTYRMYPTYNENAKYQLEFYRTKEHPRKNICVLNKNKNKFSYKIGDTVDVMKEMKITNGLWLKNIVMNETLQKLSR